MGSQSKVNLKNIKGKKKAFGFLRKSNNQQETLIISITHNDAVVYLLFKESI